MGQSLRARGQNSRLPQARRAGSAAVSEIDQLTGLFVVAQYSLQSISDREGWRVHDLWLRLRRHLLWLTLARVSKKNTTESLT